MHDLSIVIYGCLGRGFKFCQKNHYEKIFKKLEDFHISYNIIYINNHVKRIDGMTANKIDFKNLICDNYIEFKQEEIDEKISEIKESDRKGFWFKSNYSRLNEFRLSYIEKQCSNIIAKLKSKKILCFCSDLFFNDWLSKELIESIREKDLFLSKNNPAHGFTNSFYLGCKDSVCSILNSWDNFNFIINNKEVIHDYEHLIKFCYELSSAKKKLPSPSFLDVFFLKIRADGKDMWPPPWKLNSKERFVHSNLYKSYNEIGY